MSTTQAIELVVAAVALVMLWLSSWVECSLAAASRVNVRRLLDERYAKLEELEIERSQRVRSEMLPIALLSGALAAILITSVCASSLADYGFAIGLAVSAAVLLIVGRVWPRVAVRREPDAESQRVRRTARLLGFVFAPLIRPVVWLTERLMRGGDGAEPRDDDHETGHMASNGQASSERDPEEGEIEQDEQEMITGVLHLERASAREIMVPRIDIVAVSREVLVSEAVDVAIQAGHSRIPVFGSGIDEIVGVVYAKDLLRFVNEDHEGVAVETLMREAYFVPESKRVDDLLSELQQTKVHLAVVIDEYGGTAGVVTIEDILEEIVGEIQDEFDSEPPRLEVISPDEAIADGALSVDDLSDDLDLEWPEPVSGTIGGLIQRRLGRIPAEGEVVEIDGIRLTVLRVERRRVRQARIERKRAPDLDTGEGESSMAADALTM